jgi:O-antigen biosynthesis protein
VHQTAATTGAFLACRRDIFERLNGFDTKRFTVTCSDVDFCVRARGSGGMVLYDPFLTWIHYESASRGLDDDSESSRLRFDEEFSRWRAHCTAFDLVDLNLNPHFVRSPRPFEIFHRVDGQTVDTWLMAQRHRREQTAVERTRRSVEGVPGLAYSQGADPLS